MSHAISLSLRADPPSFWEARQRSEGPGVWGGVKLYG